MALLISFNGKPQAEANSGNDACGLPFKRSNQQPNSVYRLILQRPYFKV